MEYFKKLCTSKSENCEHCNQFTTKKYFPMNLSMWIKDHVYVEGPLCIHDIPDKFTVIDSKNLSETNREIIEEIFRPASEYALLVSRLTDVQGCRLLPYEETLRLCEEVASIALEMGYTYDLFINKTKNTVREEEGQHAEEIIKDILGTTAEKLGTNEHLNLTYYYFHAIVKTFFIVISDEEILEIFYSLQQTHLKPANPH